MAKKILIKQETYEHNENIKQRSTVEVRKEYKNIQYTKNYYRVTALNIGKHTSIKKGIFEGGRTDMAECNHDLEV